LGFELVPVVDGESVLGFLVGKLSEDNLRGDNEDGGDTTNSALVVNDVPALSGGYRAVLDGIRYVFADVVDCVFECFEHFIRVHNLSFRFD